MLPSFIIVVALALLAVGVWWIASLRSVKIVLRRVADPRNPEVIQRVYVERPGLRAKLWFEASANSPTGFVVHFRGNSEDFTVTPLGAEPIQIQEFFPSPA